MAYSRTADTLTRTLSSWSELISYWRVQSAVLHACTLCWSTAGSEFRQRALASTSSVIDYVTVLPTPGAEVLAVPAPRRLAVVALTDYINHIQSVRQQRVCSMTTRPLLRSVPVLWNGLTLRDERTVRSPQWRWYRTVRTKRIDIRRLRTATQLRLGLRSG